MKYIELILWLIVVVTQAIFVVAGIVIGLTFGPLLVGVKRGTDLWDIFISWQSRTFKYWRIKRNL